jgi:hypothetical protein
MNYLVNPDISEEIDGRETDPLTGNIIGAAIDVHHMKHNYCLIYGFMEPVLEDCLLILM